MKSKATHRGTCQACGAVQKLPDGVLSTHGYTVRWSFFNGICRGTGHKPYEQSTDVIETFIAFAETQQSDLEVFKQRVLAEPVAGTVTAWVNVYRSGKRGVPSHYTWLELPIVFTLREGSGGFRWHNTQYEHPGTSRLERLDVYGVHSGDPLDYIRALAVKRATAVDAEIDKIKRYIVWQQGRVTSWTLQPLLSLVAS